MEASGAPDENLCPNDFNAKLAAHSGTDKLKLSAIEDHLCRGTGMKSGELHHEVVCRVWLGKRRCPVGVAVMAFFVNAMKSIAGHERTKRKGLVPLHAVAREGQMAPAATALAPEVEKPRRNWSSTVSRIPLKRLTRSSRCSTAMKRRSLLLSPGPMACAALSFAPRQVLIRTL